MPDAIPELTRDQVRRVDRIAIDDLGMSGLVLMENAGRGCVELLMRQHPKSVVVCCGKGNNGGDGFVMARHLSLAGVPVKVLLATESGDDFAPDAAVNFGLLEACEVPVVRGVGRWPAELEAADWVVDSLLGTGATGPPRAPLDAGIEAITRAARPTLAVDIPSGLDCDTGEQPGVCVQAALTATFVAPKVGFATKSAAGVLGRVEVVGIGVPRVTITEAVRQSK